MRWTNTLIATLREPPAEAEILSHKLLLRAGLIRKLAGASIPFCRWACARCARSSRSFARKWTAPAPSKSSCPRCSRRNLAAERTLRNDARRPLQGHDSARREWVLGPTHEEVITLLVAAEIIPTASCPKNFIKSR